MDIKTGLSIFNKQWLIEPSAALQMLDFWQQVREGKVEWNYRGARGETELDSPYATYQKLFAKQNVAFAPDNSWDMMDFEGFDGASVAVIPVSGPLMKSDFCGSFGTRSLSQLTQMASNTASIKTIVFLIDSPGGTVDGNQSFADAIKSSPKNTISLVDGLMCSAAYWLGSSADQVFASSRTDIIGSIGTMVSWYDNSEAMKARGIVLREFYATESKDKNRIFSDAEKGNAKALVQEYLDPMNDVFLEAVRQNRGDKLSADENPLTGKTYIGQKAVDLGLVDGIQSFDETIATALQSGPIKSIAQRTFAIQTEKKTSIMTLAEFKQQHPSVHAEAVQEGVAQERDRVGAFLTFNDVDPEAVTKGIREGGALSATHMAEFNRKAFAKQAVGDLESDSAKPIRTSETANQPSAEEKAKADFEAEVNKSLGLKKSA